MILRLRTPRFEGTIPKKGLCVEFITIFNDVLGPVMRGPSSSHTAGAYRIACLSKKLFGGEATNIRCTFDPDGSYAPTYKALGVDLAFAAGFLDWPMTDSRYVTAVEELAASGTELEFCASALQWADHPNTVRIEMRATDGTAATVWAKSTGGGVVELFRLDGFDIGISGKRRCLVIRSDAGAIMKIVEELGAVAGEPSIVSVDGAAALAQFDGGPVGHLSADDISDFSATTVRLIDPVFFPEAGPALFESAADIFVRAEKTGDSLGSLGMEYECNILGMSAEDVMKEMLDRYRIMRQSVEAGLDPSRVSMDILEPSASEMMRGIDAGALPSSGAPGKAAARALAVMHTCNSRGVVCAAPTGGSAGVIPATVMSLAENLRATDEKVAKGLFAAGIVGMVVARRATFAAETAGCQAEIGVAGAMASAACVDMSEGSAETAMAAAAISLQNTMGSVCDPVKGGCEIPCHTRNAVSAAAAFTCASLAMGGYRNPIPLDETIDASYAVGKSLPRELRCTALGGIAVTPSALKL